MALHEIWPTAPLYTAVYDKAGAPWASVFDVRPSWLQHVPFAMKCHEWYPWLTPLAFESFNFDEYDVVISVTSAEAKNIITKPGTTHICYCLTPTRYLWSGYETYADASVGLRVLAPTLRNWDRIASSRPDYYLAISKRVKERIETYYGREVEKILYPPAGLHKFQNPNSEIQKRDDYYLVVSRLVPYKRVDIVIEAFNELGWKLVIVGDGTERKKLQTMARHNVEFVTRHLTDEELVGYYQSCAALVIAADEDFGIAAVEAQAAGRSVVAYAGSGIAEIVQDGKTGILFTHQTKESLIEALKRTKTRKFQSSYCQKNAMRFARDRFIKEMKDVVEGLINKTI